MLNIISDSKRHLNESLTSHKIVDKIYNVSFKVSNKISQYVYFLVTFQYLFVENIIRNKTKRKKRKKKSCELFSTIYTHTFITRVYIAILERFISIKW